jgi:hypothetical protein
MDSRIFKGQLQGSKLIGLRCSFYHWKALKTEMSEMGLHDPFGHLKHKLWPKERLGVKLAIWLPTTKSQELTRFPCLQMVYDQLLKAFDKGYNFASNLISIRGLRTKLWAPKIAKVPTLGISCESFGTKCHLDVGLMERHIIYYKGEGGGFPQVQAVVSLVSLNLSMVRPSTKSALAMH